MNNVGYYLKFGQAAIHRIHHNKDEDDDRFVSRPISKTFPNNLASPALFLSRAQYFYSIIQGDQCSCTPAGELVVSSEPNSVQFLIIAKSVGKLLVAIRLGQ